MGKRRNNMFDTRQTSRLYAGPETTCLIDKQAVYRTRDRCSKSNKRFKCVEGYEAKSKNHAT